jgi:hypothetical protein
VVTTTFRPLYLRETPSTHCTRGWLGFGAGLDCTVNLGCGSTRSDCQSKRVDVTTTICSPPSEYITVSITKLRNS